MKQKLFKLDKEGKMQMLGIVGEEILRTCTEIVMRAIKLIPDVAKN